MKASGPVAVTGASGFVGRRLAALLNSRGTRVARWSRPQVDLLDAASVVAASERDAPKTICHLAATGVSAAHAHDSAIIAANLSMTQNLLAAAPEGARIVIAGSMSEYGRAGRLAESDRCTPRTAYGIAKLASGLYAAAYGPLREQRVSIARLFGVYGPGEAPQRLFPSLIDALRRGEPVDLSEGLQRRDFVHVDDACAALAEIAAVDTGGDPAVNLGTGQAVRVRDVAQWIAESLGASPDLLRFGARPRSPGDEDLLEADTTRLISLIGYAPPQRLESVLSADLFA